MAHKLEQFADGTTAFASAREDAWHRLGVVTTDAMTAQEALSLAMLGGWNVRKSPLTATVEDAFGNLVTVPVDGRYATVRTNAKTGRPDILGVVGEDYVPVQNEAHCDLLNALVDESGAHFETAGSLNDGRNVFVTMKLPETMLIGGHDRVDLYIAALNSHDGSSAFRLLVTPIRVVCANTQAAALRNAKASFSIRHTSGARAHIQEARNALGLTWAYVEAFEREAQRMIEAEYTAREFDALARQLLPAPKDGTARQDRNHEDRISSLKATFARGTTVGDRTTMSGIEGTRWSAYQAVTEWADHLKPVSGEQRHGRVFASAQRARRTITDTAITDLKARAFAALTV